jgi:anaerobic selenocysteine-containing dehydrogenase
MAVSLPAVAEQARPAWCGMPGWTWALVRGPTLLCGEAKACTATAEWALVETFGSDGDPGSYTDIDACDTLFLVGHNVAETQTDLWMRMLDRLHGPDRPRLVVIDPRVTAVARQADVHLAVLPGTNVAVLNAILHELIANGWVDHEWVRQHGRLRRPR